MKGATWVAAALALLGLVPEARAGQPATTEMAQVQTIAHRLQAAVGQVQHLAQRQSHRFGRKETRAMARLVRLEQTIAQFHGTVEGFIQNPYHLEAGKTEAQFRDLIRTYNRTVQSFDELQAYGEVYRAFHDVQDLMNSLVSHYGGPQDFVAYRLAGADYAVWASVN